MKKALVLCGGGSLGSYEVGAWRYLREKGESFDIVCGTSIGAINGAMVAIDAYEECLRLWEAVTIDKVMTQGFNISEDILSNVRFVTQEKFRKVVGDYIRNKGVDISPFKKLVKETIDPKKIKESKTTLGIVTTDYKARKEVDIVLNEKPEELILPYLHASSACWPIFPMELIRGKKYIDGGYLNNLPIDFAIRLGADEVVAVLLHSIPKEPQNPELMDLPFVKTIRPSRDTGTILYFEKDILQNNIRLGYLDAKKTFGASMGFFYCFQKEGEYQNIASKTYLDFIRKNTYKASEVKKALFPKTNIKEHSAVDYLVRGLEILGEVFHISPYEEWRIEDFIFSLKKAIKSYKKEDIAPFEKQKKKTSLLGNVKYKDQFLVSLYRDLKKGSKTEWIHRYESRSPEVLYFLPLLQNIFLGA